MSFRQIQCASDDPEVVARKRISFSNQNFFIGCPVESFIVEDLTGLAKFDGLQLKSWGTGDTQRYLFKGTESTLTEDDGLYAFGFTTKNTAETLKV